MKRLVLIFLIALVQVAQAQTIEEYHVVPISTEGALKSLFNDEIEPPADALNDSAISKPGITWVVAIEQFADIFDQQTAQGTIGQGLIRQVLEKKAAAYRLNFRGDLTPLVLKRKKLYSPYHSAPVYDLGRPEDGDGAGATDVQYCFSFIEYLYWNWNTQKLTAKIPYAGVAWLHKQSAIKNLFYVPLKEAGEARQTKKILCETDHYFEDSLSIEDEPALEEEDKPDFARIICSYAIEGILTLRDTDGVSQLSPADFENRYMGEPDTAFNTWGSMSIVHPESYDNIKYFGVLQHITIYDDWTVHVEIKGLMPFATKDRSEPKPMGWIDFRMEE